MSPEKKSVYLLVFVLLAYAGQLFAAVDLPCNNMHKQTGSVAMDTPMAMDHSSHTMHGDPETTSSLADCCGDNQCSMSHCLSTSLLGVVSLPSPLQLPRARILNTEYARSFLNSETTPLFRPPITR